MLCTISIVCTTDLAATIVQSTTGVLSKHTKIDDTCYFFGALALPPPVLLLLPVLLRLLAVLAEGSLSLVAVLDLAVFALLLLTGAAQYKQATYATQQYTSVSVR